MNLNWISLFRSFFTFHPRRHIYRTCAGTLNSKSAIEENPFYSKYAKKISEKKSSPEKLEACIEGQLQSNKIANLSSTKKDIQQKQTKFERHKSHNLKKKDLNEIMKVDSVKMKSPKEIESIWKQYHSGKDAVYAVLPGESYKKLSANFGNFPTFLFPLPRDQGYEFMMLQYFDQSCYFTSLINYQCFKENAPVCLTVTYFTEFLQDKDIVLMRGEYDDNALKIPEVQCLTNQLQLFYGGSDKQKYLLIERFNKYPTKFKHSDLISNFELGLGNSA